MKKEIVITKVEVLKEGTSKKGHKWTLVKVYCDGDNEMSYFTDFDSKWKDQVGNKYIGEFFLERNGEYENWRPGTKKVSNEDIMEALRKLYKLVDDRLPEAQNAPKQ